LNGSHAASTTPRPRSLARTIGRRLHLMTIAQYPGSSLARGRWAPGLEAERDSLAVEKDAVGIEDHYAWH
jgi:hypothetical protein